jgi:predicted RNA-binding protein with PUA-like domain
VREHYPDHTALDKKSKYYDPRHTNASPVWFMVDVKLVSEWDSVLSLEKLKQLKEDEDGPHAATLQNMMLLKKGSRLSVQPMSDEEWDCIQALKYEMKTRNS